MDRLGEEEHVDLIMLAATRLSKEHYGSVSDSNIQWAKLVFAVAEDLQLDITRYWYTQGCYIESPHARPSMAAHLARKVIKPGFPDPNTISVLAESRAARYQYNDIHSAVEKHLDIFAKEPDALRLNIFEHDAPEQFRAAYLGHYYFTKVCDEVASLKEVDSPDLLWRNFSDRVSDLHNGLYLSKIRMDCRAAMVEYTSFMESLVQKLAFVDRPDEEWVQKWTRAIKTRNDVYSRSVWRFPASQFGAQSIVGPGKDRRKPELLRTMDESKDFVTKTLPEIEREAVTTGMMLSQQESSVIMSKILPDASARDGIAKAYYDYNVAK